MWTIWSDGEILKSSLSLYEKRLKLLWELKKRGFYVRMHAYEYLIGDGDRFKVLLFLEPELERAILKILDNSVARTRKTIEEVLFSIDPRIRVEVI